MAALTATTAAAGDGRGWRTEGTVGGAGAVTREARCGPPNRNELGSGTAFRILLPNAAIGEPMISFEERRGPYEVVREDDLEMRTRDGVT